MFTLVAHGGAGDWRASKERLAVDGVARSVEFGRGVLQAGGSSLDAVVATVRALEDHPMFNAGTGGALNLDGEIELDASIMFGPDRSAGAVANIRRVQHPIDVALAVMQRTDHVMLAGEGAIRFARALGFEDYDPETPDRRRAFDKHLARLHADGDDWLPRLNALLREYPELSHGTVGAVAIDDQGRLAAATSTGGVVLKLVGRIGDSPLLGAGTWADEFGAAGATGRGEIAMRTLATRRVAELIRDGADAQSATDRTVEEAAPIGDEIGLIAVDAAGRVGVTHGTQKMPHAIVRHGAPTVAGLTMAETAGR